MPFSDPERSRRYFREYRRRSRAGSTCSTQTYIPTVDLEFRLDTAADVIGLLEAQVEAVLHDEESGAIEKARCVGYLAGISLKAIECGNLAARLETIEESLKNRGEKS